MSYLIITLPVIAQAQLSIGISSGYSRNELYSSPIGNYIRCQKPGGHRLVAQLGYAIGEGHVKI